MIAAFQTSYAKAPGPWLMGGLVAAVLVAASVLHFGFGVVGW